MQTLLYNFVKITIFYQNNLVVLRKSTIFAPDFKSTPQFAIEIANNFWAQRYKKISKPPNLKPKKIQQ